MITFDLVIDSVEKGLDSFIIADLYKLNADLVFVNPRLKFIKILHCFHDCLLNIFEPTFWRSICKNKKVEARTVRTLVNFQLLEITNIDIQVMLEPLISRCVASWRISPHNVLISSTPDMFSLGLGELEK